MKSPGQKNQEKNQQAVREAPRKNPDQEPERDPENQPQQETDERITGHGGTEQPGIRFPLAFHPGKDGQELPGQRETGHEFLSATPASVKVAISVRIFTAASMMDMARAAPVPSPRRRDKLRIGFCLKYSHMNRWPISTD